MRFLILWLALLVCGCEQAYPRIDLSIADVERNRGASCCHAAVASLLKYQGEPELAEAYFRRHRGGSYDTLLAKQLADSGVKYAMTSGEQDDAWLRWAMQSGHGAAVGLVDFYGPRRDGKHYYHAVLLLHLDSDHACLVDVNFPEKTHWIDASEFLQWWHRTGSWAFTTLYPEES